MVEKDEKDNKHRKELRAKGHQQPVPPRPQGMQPPQSPPVVLEGKLVIGVSAKYVDPPGEGKFGCKVLNIIGEIPNEQGAIKSILIGTLNSLERLPVVGTAKKPKNKV